MPTTPLHRRTFLRAAGICVGLPLLDAMLPVGFGAERRAAALRAKRMLLVGRPLGLHGPYLFPQTAGKDFEPPPYLKMLAAHRHDLTVFSGMSHVGYPGGHGTEPGLLTGVPPENWRSGRIRNTVSLDQEVAARVGGRTRHACLVLGGGSNLSWTRGGVMIPPESDPARVFRQLFVDGTPAEVAREVEKIEAGRSILDGVRDEARTLAGTLGPADRRRVDQLLTSVREAEARLQHDQNWVKTPKPKVDVEPPRADPQAGLLDRERQWFDLARLAFQTDSARVISLFLASHADRVPLPDVSLTTHDASHHGQDEEKLRQLAAIEGAELAVFGGFLTAMKGANDGGPSLLDGTVVFYASSLGNASAHTTDNLPVLLAGGGFKHAGHVAFDRKHNEPLSNLFVRMLHQVGVEADRFGNSTGVVTEV